MVAWCGSTVSGNTRTINYFLDVNGGASGNGTNIQLWLGNNSNAQRFSLQRTERSTYILRTKASSYNRAAVVQNASCSNGGNVFQWQHNTTFNDEWILQPVNGRNSTLGNLYATANWNRTVSAFPNVEGMGGNCANFVSQVLLASGVPYRDDWKVYRKNGNYSRPINVAQLNDSWELVAPRTSPWVSTPEFYRFWKPRVTTLVMTGQQLLDNAQALWNANFLDGMVVQYATRNILGNVSTPQHSMIIRGTGAYKGQMSYTVTFQSSTGNHVNSMNLLQVAEKYKNYAFIFYAYSM